MQRDEALQERFLDDFTVGERFRFGPRTLTEDEIVAFAREVDPQPFHVDPVAAAESAFGGLIAVGWHTCIIGYRLVVDGLLRSPNLLAGIGVDELRFRAPVRPGTVLWCEVTVAEVRASSSRPDRGVLGLDFAVIDGTDPTSEQSAATYRGLMLWRRR